MLTLATKSRSTRNIHEVGEILAREGATLHYSVSDDGEGIKDSVIKPGTGLSNIARRLELLFPGAHAFALAPRSPKSVP